jgi:hypothetical protein
MLLSFLGHDPETKQEKIESIRSRREERLEELERKANEWLKKNKGKTTHDPIFKMNHGKPMIEESNKMKREILHVSRTITPIWMTKVWSECLLCMSSFWGTVTYILMYFDFLSSPIALPYILIVIAGVQDIYPSRKEKEESTSDYYSTDQEKLVTG